MADSVQTQVADMQRKLQQLRQVHLSVRKGIRGRWIRTLVRWAMTTALYVAFWEHQWVRLTLLVVLPLAVLNGLNLVAMTWLLPRTISRLEQRLRNLDAA